MPYRSTTRTTPTASRPLERVLLQRVTYDKTSCLQGNLMDPQNVPDTDTSNVPVSLETEHSTPCQPKNETGNTEYSHPTTSTDRSNTNKTTKISQKRTRRVGTTDSSKKIKIHQSDGSTVAAEASSIAFHAGNFKVQSKHDEKWNNMFEKLVAYKNANNSTSVPQCYDQDPQLGRWVHYQRVEYWLYKTNAKAKINPERIARLESIGFDWDPQKANWERLFARLEVFHREHGHCKVPKGYAMDPELANWVRNQRLEFTNMQKGKKNRMTQERLDRLNDIGFRWSNSTIHRVSMREILGESDKDGIIDTIHPSVQEKINNEKADGTLGK